MNTEELASLIEFLRRIPAILPNIVDSGTEKFWWVKFQIDPTHQTAWHTIQELGHVINYLSIEDRLPTQFYPVSPPPYLNGGPEEFLSWVIETKDATFSPRMLRNWLESRLPNPVETVKEWLLEEE